MNFCMIRSVRHSWVRNVVFVLWQKDSITWIIYSNFKFSKYLSSSSRQLMSTRYNRMGTVFGGFLPAPVADIYLAILCGPVFFIKRLLLLFYLPFSA
eukprot:UN01240